MTRAKQLAKWLGLTAAGLLLLLGLAGGLGYGYLQSDGGREWAARAIERLVSTPGEVEVRIGELTGQIPFAVAASEVRVSDGSGQWLVIEALGYELVPDALLQSTLRFRALEADLIRLDRLPSPAAPDPDDDAASSSWPTLPFAIRLENLALREVALGPEVLGEAAAFRVDGEARSPDGSEVDASLTLERIDGQAGSARAALRYVFAESFLDLDAHLEEPAGGLVVRALGLDELPALAARVTGQGPLSDWAGNLSLSLENLAEAKADLRLSGADDPAFAVTGSLDTLADFEELPWRLLRGHLDFETKGEWRGPATLVLDRGRVTGQAIDLTLAGTFELEGETLEAEATLRLPQALDLEPYLPNARLAGLDATATASGGFEAPEIAAKATADSLMVDDLEVRDLAARIDASGPLSHPRLSLDLKASGMKLPDVAAEDVTATIAFDPAADFDPDHPKGKVVTSGSAGRLDLSAVTDWWPAIGQRLTWEIDAEVDAGPGEIRAASLSLESERGRLTGEGSFAWESGATEARLQLGYSDLAPVGPLLGFDLEGRLQASADITSAGPLGVLDAEIAGSLADLVLPDPILQALAGPTLEVRGTVGLAETGALTLAGLHLTSPAAEVTGDMDLGPDLYQVSATYRAEVGDLAVLSQAVGEALSGSAVVTGRAEGRFEALELDGELKVPAGSIATVPVEALSAHFTAGDVATRPSGRLRATFGSPVGDLTARTDYTIGDDALDLTALSFDVEGLSAEGGARVPFSGAPLTLGLDGRAETLLHWLALAGLAGDGRGTFRLDLSPDGTRQAGRLEASLEDTRLDLGPEERLTAAKLSATLDAADLLGSESAEASLSARDLEVSDLQLASLDIEGAGGLAGGDISVTAVGDWFGDLSLESAGRVALDGERVEVEVSRLTGRAFQEDLALQHAATFTLDGPAMEISGLDLTYGEARLNATARRTAGELSADITVENLPLTALRPVIDLPLADGHGNARLQLSGSAEAPVGELAVDIRQIRIAELSEVPAFDLDFQGRWRDGVLTSTGRLAGLTDEDVALSFDLPLRMDPVTLIPTIPPDGPLAGKLDWQGPIDPLWALVPTNLHELGGTGDIHASLAGTAAAPKLGGGFELRQGRYESLEAGTLLSDLELTGDLADNRIQLTRLSARDGGSGKIEATGVIELESGQGFTGELEAKFKKFALLRRDEITAVAKGDIQVTGSTDQSLVKGRIETDTVHVYIPDRLPPDVVDLAVVEEGAPPADPTAPGNGGAPATAHRTTFDLTIDIPRRAFIRGRGIDSEWAGTLTLSGTDDKVAIKGKLKLVRGRVAALGKTFQLDEGSVTFLGTTANDPDLKIVARRKTEDLDVTITVSGPLSNPRIAFTSVPELPEDEVISQVLFGKSTSQLSAGEAAQLAASVAELTGQAGGAGSILGRVRASLGVDVLRLESEDSSGASAPGVAAGKYITEDVYVGAKQGTETDSGTAEVEVELTPNISIGSEVGQQGQSEVGIKFKWDY